MIEFHPLNKQIVERFGRVDSIKIRFRIVRGNQTEKRVVEDGTVQEVLKYSYIPSHIWILEGFSQGNFDNSLPDAEKGTYEPIYVFWNAEQEYKEPYWLAVEFLLKHLLEDPVTTKAQAEKEDAEDFARRRAVCYDMLDNASPWIPSQLKDGYGIVVPSNYEKE